MTRRILALVFLLGAVPTWIAPVAAAKPQDKTVREWLKRMRKVDRWLETGHWAPAEQAAGELAEDMAHLITGDKAHRVLAQAITFRALACAGLGREEEALWYWQVAQNLDPKLRRGARFPPFGEAGRFLELRPLRQAGETPPGRAASEDGELTPPGPLFVPPPEAPRSLAHRGWHSDRFRVEVVVAADGWIYSPVVLEGELPGKIYLGLQALRRWRFVPARSAGETVDALLTLTDFTAPRSFAFAMANDERTRGVHELLMTGRRQVAVAAAEAEIAGALGHPAVRVSPEVVGRLTALRALAQASLGLTEDALWSWHLAHAFDTSLGGFELTAYGPAGRLLERHPVRCLEAPESCAAVDLNDPHGDLRPPRRVDPPAMSLPSEAPAAAWPEGIVVRAVVDVEGRVREPKILTDHSPAAAYRALESLVDWRFEPAAVGGRPVAAVYELTIPLAPEATAAGEATAEEATAAGEATDTPDPPAQSADGPMQVAGDVRKPIKIYSRRPRYTPEARQAKLEGTVVVQAIIDTDGLVQDLKVVKGLPMGLTEKALEAISRWRFKPATRDGVPVSVYYNLTVNFRL